MESGEWRVDSWDSRDSRDSREQIVERVERERESVEKGLCEPYKWINHVQAPSQSQ